MEEVQKQNPSQTECASSMRIIHFSDPQLGFGEEIAVSAEKFRAATERINAMRIRPDCAIICGDMLHAPDCENVALFRSIAEELETPLLLLHGNHDGDEHLVKKDFMAATEMAVRRFGPDHYSRTFGNTRIIIINTQAEEFAPETYKNRQRSFLERELAEAFEKSQCIIVAGHHPPFRRHRKETPTPETLNENARDWLLSKCLAYNVRFYLCGHTHERIRTREGSLHILGAETLCNNFDRRPFGYRILDIRPDDSFSWRFVRIAPSREKS